MGRFKVKRSQWAMAGVCLAGLCAGLLIATGGGNVLSLMAMLPVSGIAIFGLAGLAIWSGLRLSRQKRRIDALAAALNVTTTRLSIAEARLGAIDTSAAPALRSNVSELTAEIGLLGGLVRDLAETVAVHDRRLEAPPVAMPAPILSSLPPVAAPSIPHTSPPVPPPVAAPTDDPAVQAAAFAAWPSFEERPAPPIPVAANDPRGDAIVAALRNDEIEIHLQPLVSLPQRRVRGYEMLSRLKLASGETLSPAEFLPAAERHGLAAQLDERNVARAMAIARHLTGRGSDAFVACNLSPAALAAPGFLRSLSRIVAENADMAGRLLLEISQRSLRTLDAERLGGLGELAAKGIRLSMDQVSDFRLDPTALAERGVTLVKVRAARLLQAEAAPFDIALADLSALLARAGIALVAEHVENEETVRDLLDFDVPVAQGFLFSPPRPVRSDVFLAPPPLVSPPPAETPERRPLRDVLRRAQA